MSARITDGDLRAVCSRLNLLTSSPLEPYSTDAAGKLVANIGCFHLSHAYGGVSLHRMHNEAGGVTTPLGGGHMPKRELYERMQAFAKGLEFRK